jgi:hypothetical protein
MKRFSVFVILLLLTATASAVDWEKQQKVRQELERQLFRDFCEGVREGGKCKIPSPWDEEFWGVCCGGTCNGYTDNCKKPGFGGPSLLDVIVNMPCMDRGYGRECEIPQEIERKYPDLSGVCCDGQCVYMEEKCDEGYGPDRRDDGPPSPEEIKEIVDYYVHVSCIAIKNGEPCSEIKSKDPVTGEEHSLAEEFNLFGVCCSEKCHLRSTECPEVNVTKPDLVIVGMDIYPEDPSVNIQIENLTVTIKNQGNAKTTDLFWVEILKGDESAPINHRVEEDLNAGEAIIVPVQGMLPYQKTGRYTLTVIVDSSPNSVRDNLIDESDEANNRETWTIFVGEAPSEEIPVRGEDKKEDKPSEEGGGGAGIVLLFFALIIFLLAIAAFFLSRRKQKKPVFDYDLQIKRLLSEKRTVEEMIELAKVKYHKRKLDEESFREIVRDNQKRLIEIETKIKDMEARMNRLEKG